MKNISTLALLGILVTVIGGVLSIGAYSHTTFQTIREADKGELRMFKQLDRIESKVDSISSR